MRAAIALVALLADPAACGTEVADCRRYEWIL